MMNRAMEEKLAKQEAIDVSDYERTWGGIYVLPEYVDGVDYCDAVQEAWVWSIGKLLVPEEKLMADHSLRILPAGTILASLDSRFYSAGESKTVECLWLR